MMQLTANLYFFNQKKGTIPAYKTIIYTKISLSNKTLKIMIESYLYLK